MSPSEKEARIIKSTFYLSITFATIILVAKGYGWIITDSQTMLASLIDSLLDITSSLINLIAVYFAFQPPDHNHRFGHEKFQDLAIFSQSMFFFASSLFTICSAVKALFKQAPIEHQVSATYIMYFCVCLTLILVAYQTLIIKKTGSKIVMTDKLHYLSDLLMNILVIISMHLSGKYWFMDSLFAMGISIYIIHASYELFRHSIRNLADEEFEEKERQKIIAIINKYPQIQGIHELKTRYAATKPFIQFHLEMDGNTSLNEAYSISKKITAELLLIFIGGEIIIHQQPFNIQQKIEDRGKL